MRDPGQVYAKAAAGGFAGTDMASTLAYSDLQLSLYAEVGLPARLQLAAFAPWVQGTHREGELRYVARSLGDAEVQLSRQLLDRSVVVALTGAAKLPLYGDRTEARARAFGPLATRFPDAGDGQVDLDLRVEAGASLGHGVWVQAWTGWRHRFGPPVDGVPWAAQAGLAPRALGWAGVEASGIVNVSADPDTRSWTRLGGFVAARVGWGVAIEAWGGWIPVASASRTGLGGGMGVSWGGG